MSHSQISFSPAGTSMLERTVGELVAERPGRSRIFQAGNIDFCCQGSRTLREACERKGIAADTVVEQLEAEMAGKATLAQNPADLPPRELIAYIVKTHHDYLRRELPRLHQMAERVAQVHGGHTPALVEVFHVFGAMENELSTHIMKEEMILFPLIAALSRNEAVPMPPDGPVACMMHEHDDAGASLARLRELTRDFQPPVDACNTYRALFAGLHELEEDLHRHIHLENSVLFPTAQRMAVSAPKSSS
jgi:regulator of cell morphogenesis and NO signaling